MKGNKGDGKGWTSNEKGNKGNGKGKKGKRFYSAEETAEVHVTGLTGGSAKERKAQRNAFRMQRAPGERSGAYGPGNMAPPPKICNRVGQSNGKAEAAAASARSGRNGSQSTDSRQGALCQHRISSPT